MILEAARRVFSETGNMSTATTKRIAVEAGITEGLIYRHFPSKEELFFAAVAEPLEATINDMVEISMDNLEGLTKEEQFRQTRQMFTRLIGSLGDVLPLLGLILFGDPAVARAFYREVFAPALAKLSSAWREFYALNGIEVPAETIAEGILGMSLMVAIKVRHSGATNVRRISEELAELSLNGFFPSLDDVVPEPAPARSRKPAVR